MQSADSRLVTVRAIAFDFDGVFTDDRVVVSETGEESVVCSRSDGMGIEQLRIAGIRMTIISKETNPVVLARARKLSLDAVVGCNDKLPEFVAWMHRIGCSPQETAYMGNDVSDLECLTAAGLAIAPADAHPEVLKIAGLTTVHPGGRGAIREVADRLLAALQHERER